jgi:hypothetical protein
VVATSAGPIARFVRMNVVPRVLPVLFHFEAMRRFMFRAVSQIAINYRQSPISVGALGSVHGGDRLPWVPLDGDPVRDNFAVIDGRQWQVHIYGAAQPALAETCRSLSLPLHVFSWRAAMRKAGLTENGLYLVRPDGYVALVDPGTDPGSLARQMEAVMARPAARVAASAREVAAVG